MAGLRTLAASRHARFDLQMADQANVSRRAQRAMLKQRHRTRTAVAATAVLGAVAVVLVLLLSGGSDDDTVKVDVDMFEFGLDGDLGDQHGHLRAPLRHRRSRRSRAWSHHS